MTHSDDPDFDLADFLPYLLNQAAEAASLGFQNIYRNDYGMLRTEWRILFHLGRYGDMTATEIGKRSLIHKTKISRAVTALEEKRFLMRKDFDSDRRSASLSLTAAGRTAYRKLTKQAADYDRSLARAFSAEEQAVLRKCLRQLAAR
ncbi:MarR family transcriptional regulator [Rhodobacteraceae bacterium DSL-40]|uniref:MarR family winged helix-turn-helix transcriptional regulator n=1 Tax=Amaricoccus sp. B4 TaxID=3368557 RepID=UPI000DAC3A4D